MTKAIVMIEFIIWLCIDLIMLFNSRESSYKALKVNTGKLNYHEVKIYLYIMRGFNMLRNLTTIYIRSKDKILLLYRVGSRVVQPSWCGIGGHFEKDELNNPEACALRELFEETGITQKDIRGIKLKYITLRMKNNEIRQNYYYFTELLNTEIDISQCNEGVLEWVDMDNILYREMPFTAKECLRHYLSIGKHDNKLYAGVATDGGVIFTELKEF